MQSNKEYLGNKIPLTAIYVYSKRAWKKLLLASFLGALIGVGNWYLNSTYVTDVVLINNAKNPYERSFDIVAWKDLQRGLAPLAAKIIGDRMLPDSEAAFYRTISSDAWWDQNATPTFALSKNEAKEFPGAGKSIETALITLLKVVIHIKGSSEELSKKNAALVAKFIRNGGAYLQLKSLLNQYVYDIASIESQIQEKIDLNNDLIKRQEKFLHELEQLHRRYPKDVPNSSQAIEIKDSTIKFLPLQTQIIATNIDIISSKNKSSRLHDILQKGLDFKKMFLNRALAILDGEYDGLMISQKLLSLEEDLRKGCGDDDQIQIEFLNEVRVKILEIRDRFTSGLEVIENPNIERVTFIKSIISGTAIGFLLAFLMILIKYISLDNRNLANKDVN